MLILLILLVALLPSHIFGFENAACIEGLFEEDSLPGKAFRISKTSLNITKHGDDELIDQIIQPKRVNVTVNKDSYDISRTVHDLANRGIAAIFGPQDHITSRIVQSMCDTLKILHISARWDSDQTRGIELINMYPYWENLSMVYSQLAANYKWNTFTILYENTDSLIRMKELLKRRDKNELNVTIRQLPEERDYRKILGEVKRSGYLNIVLDCSINILPEVLKQAQQVGILSDRHSYIIATLDLQTIDLEPYRYGGTNFTGLRLIDPEDPIVIEAFDRDRLDWDLDDPSQLTVEAALVYDGVQLFGRALKQLDKAIKADVKTSLCDKLVSWEHGSSLLNFMRLTEFRGLTGLIKFDPAGHRSNFKLDVISLDSDGVKKIGVWNSSSGIEFIPKEKLLEHLIEPSLQKKTFIVLISITAPYGMLKESTEMEIGNERYEGFCIDIIKELSKILGFNYIFKEHDPHNGSQDPVTKQWGGMIQKIIDGRADLAITDLTITADRQEVVDFTVPFMNLGIGILFKVPLQTGPNFFSFLSPFSSEVWMYLIAAYTLVSVLMFIVGRLCPDEWNNPYPCIKEPGKLSNQYSFKNAFWFTLGAIMQQGSEIAPIGLSTRLLATAWSFFCLIIVPTYTANLTASLLIVSKEVLIKDVVDLANNQHGIKYGAKSSGSTIDFFNASTDPIYSKIYKYMKENENEVLLASNDDGVDKVLNENYAYFMESPRIAYEAERKCNLMQVGSLLDTKSYGIAMTKNSTYRHALNTGLLILQETGVLRDLEEKWWTQRRGGGSCSGKDKSTSNAEPLGTDNVGGIFVVLIFGTALAGIFTAWELLWKVYRTSIKENVSFRDEIKRELKFAINCSVTKKPVERIRNISAWKYGQAMRNEGPDNLT